MDLGRHIMTIHEKKRDNKMCSIPKIQMGGFEGNTVSRYKSFNHNHVVLDFSASQSTIHKLKYK